MDGKRKKGGHVEACSGHSCLPETLCHSAQCVLGNQPADLQAGPPLRPHWPCLASLWLRSRPPPYLLSPVTHTHTLSTDSSANQATPSAIPASSKSRMSFPPGIKSQSKTGASERWRRGRENSTGRAPPRCFLFCSLPDRD